MSATPAEQRRPGAVSNGDRHAETRGAGGRREVTSAELFGEAREIRIHHADEVYVLRVTSRGKLILTK